MLGIGWLEVERSISAIREECCACCREGSSSARRGGGRGGDTHVMHGRSRMTGVRGKGRYERVIIQFEDTEGRIID